MRDDFELSRMRVESTQLAPTTTTLPDACARPGLTIEILDAARQPVVVDQDPRDDRVRPDLELAGLQRERQQVIGRAEEGRRVAAGAAVAAVVAGGKPRMGRVMLARRPARSGMPLLRMPFFSSARRSAAPAAAAGTCCPAARRSRRRRRRRRSAARPGRSTARCPRRRSATGSPSRRSAAALKSRSE